MLSGPGSAPACGGSLRLIFCHEKMFMFCVRCIIPPGRIRQTETPP